MTLLLLASVACGCSKSPCTQFVVYRPGLEQLGKSRLIPYSDPAFLAGRACWIYLPPGYDLEDRRYPVLYMNDGEQISRRTGQGWEVDVACDLLIQTEQIEPIIVVGITSGPRRFYDYTPFPHPYYTDEGGGEPYLLAVRDTLKPLIDRKFRTLPDRANTWMMGASLGGLISVYAGYAHSETFGRVAGLSGSYGWDYGAFFGFVTPHPKPPLSRLYIDCGTIADNLSATREMRDVALAQGFQPGADFMYLEAEGHEHGDTYYLLRIPNLLRFLVDPPECGRPRVRTEPWRSALRPGG